MDRSRISDSKRASGVQIVYGAMAVVVQPLSGSHKGSDDVFGERNLIIVKGGRGGGGRSGSAHIHMGAAACRPGMCPVARTMGVGWRDLQPCTAIGSQRQLG